MEGGEENGLNDIDASGVEDLETSKAGDYDDEVIVHRVMKLRDNQEEETEECINDEDFMQEMDVVDAWEGDEDRLKEDLRRKNRPKDREKRLTSRERRRLERRAESREREKLRREERKREPARRDPSKSNKDIERDKIRAKRDSESKLLAEKERAIKHILDSDEVVPPGTEEDAIESIVEKQAQQETSQRRKSLERYKLSPTRRRRVSPYRRRSPIRRSPFQMSPDRRRSPQHRRSPIVISPERRRSPDRRRRSSWDRKSSTERRWSIERQKRRLEQRERELKLSSRRSRSRDRHRSPSTERRKRFSRSPRRRTHSRSRSPDRRRKRSPFINEIARQLRTEMQVASTLNRYSGPAPVNVPSFQSDPQPRPPLLPNPNFPSQGPVMPGPPVMSGSVGPPGMPGMNAPSGIPGSGGPPRMSGPPFINFDPRPSGPLMNFEQMPAHLRLPDYTPGPPPYGQPTSALGPGPLPVPVPMHAPGPAPGPSILGLPGLPLPVPSPQPVPAPGSSEHSPSSFNPSRLPVPQISPSHKSMEVNRNMNHPPQQSSYHDRRQSSPYNILEMTRDERLKTPEPPVISDSKRFEKTSLSSLLEASVSAKDSKNSPVLYPGFRPEVLRHCEYALRDLPSEDPRLKMKGRFFFDPSKELTQNETAEETSNSILLRKGKTKIDWEDLEEPSPPPKILVQMHQKICQTEEVETSSMGVQATVSFAHIGIQVYATDLQQSFTQQEKRPVTDRLDWGLRETYDYSNKMRDSEDLRWSLSNSQKRPWGRAISPERPLRPLNEHNISLSSGLSSNLNLGPSMEHPRSLNLEPLPRERDLFSGNRGPALEHIRPGNYASNFNRSLEERVNFLEDRGNFREERGNFREEMNDEIRGESPMALDDPSEDLDLDQGGFSRESIGPSKAALFFKSRAPREMPMGGRPSGRGNFRGKYW